MRSLTLHPWRLIAFAVAVGGAVALRRFGRSKVASLRVLADVVGEILALAVIYRARTVAEAKERASC